MSTPEYYKQFISHRNKDLDIWLSMDEESLRSSEDDQSWSLIQVFDHLFSVEFGVYQYIQRKESYKKKLGARNWKSILYGQLLFRALRSKKKFKIPAVLPEPKKDLGPQEIKKRFDMAEAAMNKLFEQWEVPGHALVFRHPLAGYLSLKQSVQFMHEHWEHHRPQVEKLIERYGKK